MRAFDCFVFPRNELSGLDELRGGCPLVGRYLSLAVDQ